MLCTLQLNAGCICAVLFIGLWLKKATPFPVLFHNASHQYANKKTVEKLKKRTINHW